MRLYITVFVWLFVNAPDISPLYAQRVPYSTLTISDGLSQGMVYDLLQDRKGFMWIATKDGLNRYDSYDFQLFSHNPADTFSISDDIITCLLEDNYGRIWVGTETEGINLFDPHTERFYHLAFDREAPNSLSANKINMLTQQNDTVFWAATDQGLDRITIPKGELAWQGLLGNNLSPNTSVRTFYGDDGLPCNIFQCMYTQGNRLLCSMKQGVYEIDVQIPERLTPIHQQLGLPTIEVANAYYSLYETPDGSLIMTAKDTIYIHKNEQLKRIPLLPGMSEKASLIVEKESKIWGVSNNTLFSLAPDKPANQQVIPLLNFEGDWLHTTLFTDRDGLLWVGTNGYGLRIFNPRVKNFHHYLPSLSTRQLYFDPEGRLWIWNNGRIRVWDAEQEEFYLPEGFPEIAARCNRLLNTPDGNYWFRYNIIEEGGSKLIRFHPEKKEVEYIPFAYAPPPYIPMLVDKNENIWMPGLESKMAIFDTKTKTFDYIDLSRYFPESNNNLQVNALHYESGENAIWAGTQYGLLYLQRPAKGQLNSKYYRYTEGQSSNPVSDHILSIEPAADGKLWLGTRGGGFSLFDPVTGSYKNYTHEEGLPNDVVYGIITDESGQLWLSTNRGLSCFNPTTETFRNFSSRDGLQADEFNSSSYAESNDGRLVFGGVNGINIFDPDEVQNEFQPPTVAITGISINNEPQHFKHSTLIDQPISAVRELRLPYHKNLVSIRFAALQFANPSKHHYRYQLEGIDREPVVVQGKQEVTYANLQPGHYTFKVWGSSQGGQWSNAPTQLQLHISPPIWRTTAAYAVYTLLLGLIVYLVYQFQNRRALLRSQLLYEQREAVRLAELDRLKSDFFSNITHEFRTPLTLIKEPARQLLRKLKGEKEKGMAYLISKNAEQLLQLVNQLLDISKIEGGAMKVQYEAGNLNLLLQRIIEQHQALAQQKNIHLSYQADASHEQYAGLFDKDKLNKIISNLISNAMKFTPAGGQVSIVCQVAGLGFRVAVEDTGIGIPEAEQAQIFERFYQVKSTTKPSGGTGIGLALSQELSSIIGGQLLVESTVGKGTVFTLEFPAKRINHTTPEEESEPQYEPLPATYTVSGGADATPDQDERLKVLLVEDNADLRVFIRTVLSQDYQVEEAENGRDGLTKAIDLLPDLIVSDIMMPIMDGFELTQRLKNDERTSHIPIVLLTAKSAVENRLEGYRQGADAYLGKPFYSEELKVRIQQLVGVRQLLQEKYSQRQADHKSDLPLIEQQFLQKLEDCLEQHLSDAELNAEELARLIHLSRSQLHRKLKAVTGMSTTSFIRNYRLERSRKLLLSGKNVSEVSFEVGFNSPQYFSTRFKEKFGTSPSNIQDLQGSNQ